jgi:GH43 family beta-xylosidase
MSMEDFTAKAYVNPVYPSSFPDPYVLKFRGEYFAYCTGFAPDGKVFGVLRSPDLVNWKEAGSAMEPLDTEPPFYWAPEVTYSGGQFYLYYSAGNETLMEIRVAVSNSPVGDFVDSGRRLTFQDFAIDAHVFTDDDGARYMFYATDFLEHTHIGTGTVVDRMIDWFTLEGKPRPVTRARYDWQIYDPARKEKGGVRWHTVEGPFVLKRKGRYYEMFSGGNWQNISYGVSFAATDDLNRDSEWEQFCDGAKVLPVLRTIPGEVIGPGHNSIVRGPNNWELYCVYHRWVNDQRVLAIDRMDFAGQRIFVKGATYTPQIAPFKPAISGFSDGSFEEKGQWEIKDPEAKPLSSGEREIIFTESEPCYLIEVSVGYKAEGSGGFFLADNAGKIFELLVSQGLAELHSSTGDDRTIVLHGGFIPGAVQHLRIELDGRFLRLALNDTDLHFETILERPPAQFVLEGSVETTFSGFALTRGFEDAFDRPGTAEEHGWERSEGTGDFKIENGELIVRSRDRTIVEKGPLYDNYELAVNIRLIERYAESGSGYGFILKGKEEEICCRIERDHLAVGRSRFDLPSKFRKEALHQFRVLRTGKSIHFQMEEHDLGAIESPIAASGVTLFCENAAIAMEMVRFTNLY